MHFNGLKVKRCFERVVYHFTIFGLKHEKKINFLKKIGLFSNCEVQVISN